MLGYLKQVPDPRSFGVAPCRRRTGLAERTRGVSRRRNPAASGPQGELRFRTQVCVLPEDFAVDYAAGPSFGNGVRVLGTAGAVVGTDTSNARVDAQGDAWVVSFDGAASAPGRFTLRLRWPDGTATCLALPNPLAGVRFLRGEGEALADGAEIAAAEQLAGTSVELHAPPRARGPYELVGRTTANDFAVHEFRVRLPEQARGSTTLSLSAVRAHVDRRLAMSRDIDAHVQFAVCGRGVERLRGSLPRGGATWARSFPSGRGNHDHDTLARLGAGLGVEAQRM